MISLGVNLKMQDFKTEEKSIFVTGILLCKFFILKIFFNLLISHVYVCVPFGSCYGVGRCLILTLISNIHRGCKLV